MLRRAAHSPTHGPIWLSPRRVGQPLRGALQRDTGLNRGFTSALPRNLGERIAAPRWIVAGEAARRPIMGQQLREAGDQADDDAGLQRPVVGAQRVVDGAAAPGPEKRADLVREKARVDPSARTSARTRTRGSGTMRQRLNGCRRLSCRI